MIYAHAVSAARSNDPKIAPLLSESQLREIAEFGSERQVAVGDALFVAGEATSELFVVLEGEVEVVRRRRHG